MFREAFGYDGAAEMEEDNSGMQMASVESLVGFSVYVKPEVHLRRVSGRRLGFSE